MDAWSGTRLSKPNKAETPPHAHPCIQVFCITRGVLNLLTQSRSYLIFPDLTVLIPARLVHQAWTLGDIAGWSTYLPAALYETEQVVVLRSSDLLRAILGRIAELGGLSRSRPDACLKLLVKEELQRATACDPSVPFPLSPNLRRVADAICASTSLPGIRDCARLAAMSERNLSRRFKAETGLSFERWRRRVLNEVALKRLVAGDSVGTVAERTGFQTVSAFIASFRAQFGASPLNVLAQTLDRHGPMREPK
jgi:AraC-like DNA-binding protein